MSIQTFHKAVVARKNAGGGGYTLVYNAFSASLFALDFGNVSDEYYVGNTWNDTVARTVGKISYKLTKQAGSITGKTFTVRLWTMSGTSLDVNVASSVGVAGSDAWNATDVEFTFSSPYTISTGVDYGVTIDAGGVDASNYARAYYNSTGSVPAPWPASMSRWKTDKTRQGNNNGFNAETKLYTSP